MGNYENQDHKERKVALDYKTITSANAIVLADIDGHIFTIHS